MRYEPSAPSRRLRSSTRAVRDEVVPPPATKPSVAGSFKRGDERATRRSMTLTQATMADRSDLYGGRADMLRDAGDRASDRGRRVDSRRAGGA